MAETTVQQNPATIRPCTGSGIVYNAYQRPYDGGPSKVLILFASCFYGDGPWEIFFTEGQAGTYQLLEKVPTITFGLVSYYATSFCSGAGLLELGDTVTINDSYGSHTVPVAAIGQ
jgi:hypothetical protein